jgi:predicted Zn-dependent peptidase
MKPTSRLSLLACALALTLPLSAQDSFAEFEKKVTEFTLDNGMKFLVVERHNAPVISFYTYADVGSVQEVKGITGMAHMFEHMAFKGTKKVGTKNWLEEKNSLDRVDRAFIALRAERDKGDKADKAKLEALQKDFDSAQEGAGQFVVPNELGKLIDGAGGRGLNASTASDRTDYFYSLPSNAAELWFYLESERFLNPVLREFYKEAGVVREERRMRTDSNPIGKMIEEFLTTAYKAHPYGEPGIGHMSDLMNFTRPEAEAFFEKYYAASNLTCVLAGDIDPKRARALAEAYFGRLPKRPKPEPLRITEPKQEVERRITLQVQSQPWVLIGYHKPAATHPDGPVYDAIGSLLSDGRSSRLYRRLVTEKKIVAGAGGFPDFPGEKYPGLFFFYGAANAGKTNTEVEKAMFEEIDRLRNELVTKEELEGVKRRARSSIINSLSSNTSIGIQLSKFQVLTGDWRNLFKYLNEIEKVTPEDVQRVARATFTETNRTVGYIEPAKPAASK